MPLLTAAWALFIMHLFVGESPANSMTVETMAPSGYLKVNIFIGFAFSGKPFMFVCRFIEKNNKQSTQPKKKKMLKAESDKTTDRKLRFKKNYYKNIAIKCKNCYDTEYLNVIIFIASHKTFTNYLQLECYDGQQWHWTWLANSITVCLALVDT